MCFSIFKGKRTVDIPSPRDIIANADIIYSENKQTVTIHGMVGIWLTTVADTNSMDPVVDAGHTCILTSHFLRNDLRIGDCCVYWNGSQNILHRIVAINVDEKGRYFTFRGDNTSANDKYKVRDEHVKWLLVGIIY